VTTIDQIDRRDSKLRNVVRWRKEGRKDGRKEGRMEGRKGGRE
jgi:hypothetical protein